MTTPIEQRASAILDQMTLEEKIDYIGGHNAFSIKPMPRLGLPEVVMADGPIGVRNKGEAISYPSSICTAAAWNKELAEQVGVMMGRDSRARGVHVLLGPGVNICKFPLCGRTFEYMGEDPYLTTQLALAIIKGIESQGVMACIKHLAANNQEWDRDNVSSDVDERTLHEMYLPTFEAACKAGVGSVMTSYNLLNGEYTSQSQELLDIVRNQWGYKGMIISDWTSTHDASKVLKGLDDIEMPFGEVMNRETLLEAAQMSKEVAAIIDNKVQRILESIIRFGFLDHPQADPAISLFNKPGQKVAYETACEGIVLLQNSGLLPLNSSKIKTLAVIGPRAEPPIPQGRGSSMVTPLSHRSFLDGIEDAADDDIELLYARGVPDFSKEFPWHKYCTPEVGSGVVGLKGEYFPNPDLEGDPKIERIDNRVQFFWIEYGWGGPLNDYSIRWTGYVNPPLTGDITFSISANDNFRLFIDDEIIIDRQDGQGETLQWKTVHFEVNKPRKICLEYCAKKERQAIDFHVTPGSVDFYLEKAREVAKRADAVILNVGFDDNSEGEGFDRSFILPEAQNTLINEILKVNNNVAVVVTAGGNVDMSSWVDKAPAIVHTWYPGQEGGRALADILFGKVNPSGKLPLSFERHLKDNPSYDSYWDENGSKRVRYKDGLFVGYRGYDPMKKKPLFPFGHGLSYTTFEYNGLKLGNPPFCVSVSAQVTNTGDRTGKEVVQVYVREKNPQVNRPDKELKGFTKLLIQPNKTKEAVISLDEKAFSYYDVKTKTWKFDPGEFEILVGPSSSQIKLVGKISL